MDPKSQERFDLILIKDISAVTPSDIVFLKARRDYLTDEQHMKYLDLLGEKGTGKPQPKGNSLVRFRELMKRAKDQGITVRKGIKLSELEEMFA